MRKKRLMELKPLKVMNRHIADAKKTEISLSPLEKQRGEPGKYRMYCRAAVEKGILKTIHSFEKSEDRFQIVLIRENEDKEGISKFVEFLKNYEIMSDIKK